MNDMRQILEAVKADAPPVRVSVDDIVRSGRRRVRRRAYARGAGIVCGVGAVVLAAAAVLPAAGPADVEPVGTAAPAPAPPFTVTFRGTRWGTSASPTRLRSRPGTSAP